MKDRDCGADRFSQLESLPILNNTFITNLDRVRRDAAPPPGSPLSSAGVRS